MNDAVKFLDDKDKRISGLEIENARLRERVQQLLESNNRELANRRRSNATIKLIRDTINILADETRL